MALGKYNFYTKTFGNHSIDFVGGVSAQENTLSSDGCKRIWFYKRRAERCG